MQSEEPRQVVERIRSEIEASRGSRIWPEYVQALKLISQVVFTRSSGFILELIQNAEDAGRGLDETGSFKISVNPARVKISHNGRPFSAQDVVALCGIRSSKKPEQGTLGYLGIGFKSVFKVTDAPEIYSGGYRFKFDRHDPAWADDQAQVPWHVIPIWQDSLSEPVDPRLTTFILPFKEPAAYQDLISELRRLDTGLFLFLRWLRLVRMVNEESGDETRLEHLGDTPEGITLLRQGGREQRFKLFRKIVDVPDAVMADDLTRTYRAGVRQREIAIAFGLGDEDDLTPTTSGASFGGVYSFVPLGEAKSGARYRIQADFLVQPGRDAVNHEATWNRWLVDEIATLSVQALEFFAGHERWRYQFLPTFRFTRVRGDDAHEKLFGPRLIGVVEKEVQTRPCLPVSGGGTARLQDVVRVTEELDAVKALVGRGILTREEIAGVFGGRRGLKPLHPLVVAPSYFNVPQVNRWDLLRDKSFLDEKAGLPDGPAWFRKLYLWLHEYPWRDVLPGGERSKLEKRYHQESIVLASDGRSYRGGEVLLPAGLRPSPLLSRLVDEAAGDRPVVHPEVLKMDGENAAPGKLYGFLTGKCGTQKLDAEMVCEGWVVPRIRATAPRPERDLLVEYTRACMETLGKVPGRGNELWVLDKEGLVRPARELLLPLEYHPPHLWESVAAYLPRVGFVSPDYLQEPLEPEQRAEWRRFFRSAGIKPEPDNGVEEVAINFAIEALGSAHPRVEAMEKRNLGYDLEVETSHGEVLRVEVKGLAGEGDVELTPNETSAAEMYRDSYLLCVVAPIPQSPHVHLISFPTAPGRGAKYALKIEASVWKEAKWPAKPV